MHPTAYDKARVILGAADPVFMLNKAFAGEKLSAPGEKDLKEPVDETIKLAESLGITGTPTLVLPDGRIVAGFREADRIKKLLAGESEK
jgi:thiol:disulfide interchange protein DsbC